MTVAWDSLWSTVISHGHACGFRLRRRRLAEVDGLDDVAREEQLDHPVAQHTHFALQSGELGEVDAAPHEPGQQTGETHRPGSGKRNRELGARRLMPDDAERSA